MAKSANEDSEEKANHLLTYGEREGERRRELGHHADPPPKEREKSLWRRRRCEKFREEKREREREEKGENRAIQNIRWRESRGELAVYYVGNGTKVAMRTWPCVFCTHAEGIVRLCTRRRR